MRPQNIHAVLRCNSIWLLVNPKTHHLIEPLLRIPLQQNHETMQLKRGCLKNCHLDALSQIFRHILYFGTSTTKNPSPNSMVTSHCSAPNLGEFSCIALLGANQRLRLSWSPGMLAFAVCGYFTCIQYTLYTIDNYTRIVCNMYVYIYIYIWIIV